MLLEIIILLFYIGQCDEMLYIIYLSQNVELIFSVPYNFYTCKFFEDSSTHISIYLRLGLKRINECTLSFNQIVKKFHGTFWIFTDVKSL